MRRHPVYPGQRVPCPEHQWSTSRRRGFFRPRGVSEDGPSPVQGQGEGDASRQGPGWLCQEPHPHRRSGCRGQDVPLRPWQPSRRRELLR